MVENDCLMVGWVRNFENYYIFWSNRWVFYFVISSKNNVMFVWKLFKIILLRFVLIINIISDKCLLIVLNYNYIIENFFFFIVIN